MRSEILRLVSNMSVPYVHLSGRMHPVKEEIVDEGNIDWAKKFSYLCQLLRGHPPPLDYQVFWDVEGVNVKEDLSALVLYESRKKWVKTCVINVTICFNQEQNEWNISVNTKMYYSANMCNQCNNISKPRVIFKEHLSKHIGLFQSKHVSPM